MNLGKLDRLITLQAPGVVAQNAFGETAPAVFIDAASVYAQVDYPQGAEATEAAQLQTVQPIKFRIRYRAGVETTWRIRDAQGRTLQARQDTDQVQRELGTLMLGRPTALARELGMDPAALLDRAGDLWRAGARVAIDARGRVAEYTVTVPFSQPRMTFQNRPSVHAVTERGRVASVLSIDPPAGCVRSGLNATGALNEITLVVRCDLPGSALAGMLPR